LKALASVSTCPGASIVCVIDAGDGAAVGVAVGPLLDVAVGEAVGVGDALGEVDALGEAEGDAELEAVGLGDASFGEIELVDPPLQAANTLSAIVDNAKFRMCFTNILGSPRRVRRFLRRFQAWYDRACLACKR
jgi:hypothetical protein